MHISGLTMVIRSLMGGGAERVMSEMANYWVARGVKISIITSTPPETDAYELSPEVKRIHLPPCSSFGKILGFPWSIRALRKEIFAEGHNIVISFMDKSNIPSILATRGLNVKVVVAEHIDPRTQGHSWFKKVLMRISYPRADALTVLTENVKKEWANHFIPESKVYVIHNAVLLPGGMNEQTPSWLPTKFFCCMGRLHPQKGFDILLNLLPDIFSRWPEYKLVILGAGNYRSELEAQASRLGISDKIIMPGFVENPHLILKNADIFILSSRFEGFPLALIEAMALGLPVISFDCPSGPASIIHDGINGLLVPHYDLQGMAWAINWILENPEKAKELAHNAKAIQVTCDLDRVMSMWTSLLEKLTDETTTKKL